MDSLISHLQSSETAFALFEDTRNPLASPAARLFTTSCGRAIAYRPEEIETAIAAIEAATKQGLYACGYVSYECGYYLQDRQRFSFKHCESSPLPLLHFEFFSSCESFSSTRIQNLLESSCTGEESAVFYAQLNLSPAEYLRRVEAIQALIRAGDTYQVNYTCKLNFSFNGSPLALYKSLREQQRVEYAAFLHFTEARILSFSPELFLRREGNTLTAKPMKGTASVEAHPSELSLNAKNRAENVMIVDLLRNDIGRIAQTGTVSTSELFAVESFETLQQMTSTITGHLSPTTGFGEILHKLFPCGSITGAPKIRSMEIIEQLENSPRGIYTGGLGFILPNGDFCFNVPIRTLVSTEAGRAEMGIGSGIVADSTAAEEYAECALKARFLAGVNAEFEIIESLRCEDGHIDNLDLHMNRMAISAMTFGFSFNRARLLALLWNLVVEITTVAQRIRVALRQDGSFSIDHFPIPTLPPNTRPQVLTSPHRIDSHSIFRRHKTTRRTLYENEYERALDAGAYEILFFNELGFLAEASRHNVLLELDGKLCTPPMEDGALPGIKRQALLSASERKIQERHLTLDDLQRATRIILCNAVRGETEVTLVP